MTDRPTSESSSVDEGVLDPFVVEWMAANPRLATAAEEMSAERLALSRSAVGPPPTRELERVVDDTVDGIAVRLYWGAAAPTGVLLYFHGGGFVVGSIALMDGVARELAHATGALVISVEYRLAPDHPFPAGLDDCETVTRWAITHAADLGCSADHVVVSGESAGGNLAAAVTHRLRDSDGPRLAGQILLYPGVAGRVPFPSIDEFDGLVISKKARAFYWASYSGDRNINQEVHAAPLLADDLSGLPPALVILGGCDMLRDEGRAYARRLALAGVPTDEVCYPGQPHGFMNFGFPAAAEAYERIGSWYRSALTRDA